MPCFVDIHRSPVLFGTEEEEVVKGTERNFESNGLEREEGAETETRVEDNNTMKNK